LKINIFSRRHAAAAIVLLMLTCSVPARGWCASANLWVSFSGGGGVTDGSGIESFTSKELKKSGMPTPTDVSTFATVTGLAFDNSNNLWAVANEDEVVKFSAAQLKKLKTDPNPTPGVVITSTATVGQLIGCNFDHNRNLWVANPGNY
jgi:hypothetical protein